jgi:hypothetical protein
LEEAARTCAAEAEVAAEAMAFMAMDMVLLALWRVLRVLPFVSCGFVMLRWVFIPSKRRLRRHPNLVCESVCVSLAAFHVFWERHV